MLEGHKVVALCCSEIQNENTQSMVYPLYQALSQKGWKCILFNSATDLFRNTAFDRGEASIFQLIHYDFVDAVVLYAADLKNQAMVEDIIAGANAHHKPVFVVDGNGNFSHCIDISFDEQHAFRDLVTHLVEKHHFQKFACIAGFRGNPASESRRDFSGCTGKASDSIFFEMVRLWGLLCRSHTCCNGTLPSRSGRSPGGHRVYQRFHGDCSL